MLFSFVYPDKTQSLVEVSHITYDFEENYLALHAFHTIRFRCYVRRYNEICNEIYNTGRSDIRDLEYLYDKE